MSFERETRVLRDYDEHHDIGHPSIMRNAKGFQVLTDRQLTDEEKHDIGWELMLPNIIFMYRNS